MIDIGNAYAPHHVRPVYIACFLHIQTITGLSYCDKYIVFFEYVTQFEGISRGQSTGSIIGLKASK